MGECESDYDKKDWSQCQAPIDKSIWYHKNTNANKHFDEIKPCCTSTGWNVLISILVGLKCISIAFVSYPIWSLSDLLSFPSRIGADSSIAVSHCTGLIQVLSQNENTSGIRTNLA